MRYPRTVSELRKVASMFWPEEISMQAADLSVVPSLLETQDDFISILRVPIRQLDGLFQIIQSSELSTNLFLKHLVILVDFGGEMLQRVNREFEGLFPNGIMDYGWHEAQHRYRFQQLPIRGNLTNHKLGISNKKLFTEQPLTPLHEDVIALLLFGSAATNASTAAVLSKCEVGEYLGKPTALEKYIKQRYIWVSRIIAGSESNNLGQLAQQFVLKYLRDKLIDVIVQPNGHLPNVTHTAENDTRLTTFDLVVSRGEKHIAIEISFQVTTNSVIERKAGQAKARFEQVEQAGHKIVYVIDGAGNFQRETALRTICGYSHCTVAFSLSELELLHQFLDENL